MYGLSEDELIANQGNISKEQQQKNLDELKRLDLDLPFPIDFVEPECHACVLNQLKKYEKFVDEHGNSAKGKFKVPCKGILKDLISDEMKAGFTEEQWDRIKAQQDIVYWAKKHLKLPDGSPWSARWYQEQVLRCLPGDQMVFMADGTVKRMDKIQVGDYVIGYNETKRTTSSCKVLNTFKQGKKKVYRIVLKNGDELKCTEDHPILSHYKGGKLNKLHNCPSYKTDYQSIEDGLSEGSKVYVLNKFNCFGSEQNLSLARLLGYFVTDGWVSNNSNGVPNRISFANTKKEYTDEFISLVKKVFPKDEVKEYYKDKCIGKDGCPRKEVYSCAIYGQNSQFIEFLKTINCTSKYNKEESIIDYAFKFSENALFEFINRCWSGDGSIYVLKNRNCVSLNLSSGNKTFLKKFRLLLKKIGIYRSVIYKDKKDKNNKGITLKVSRAVDVIQFFDSIGNIYGKESNSIKAIEVAKTACEPTEVALDNILSPVVTGTSLKGRMKSSSRVKIKSIEYVGEEEVYDIEVDRRHNFIAEGFIVHNCTSRRKVLRISRRSGKCISASSKILTIDGPILASEFFSLEDKPKILSFNEDSCSTEFSDAVIFDNGIKDTYILKTKNGRETVVTDNHPFLVKNRDNESADWVELKDINIGDKIAVPSTYEHLNFNCKEVGARKSRLLGYLTGDGGTSHNITCRFTNFDHEIIHDLSSIVGDYNCRLNKIADGNYNIVGDSNSYRKRDQNKINAIVNEEGLRSLAKNKKVPNSIMQGTSTDICNFLGAYWDCDGWVSIGNKNYGRKYPKVEIGVCSASKELILNIKHLLLRVGIPSNLNEKRIKYNGEINLAWQLTLTSKYAVSKFYEKIPLLAKRDKLKGAYELVKCKKSNSDILEDYIWDEVKSIDFNKEEQTYDLTVPETHTLVADDIISHNTDMVCIEICYYLFTRPNLKIVVAGPQKTHTEEIINRVRAFIASNPLLQDCVEKDVSAPYYKLFISNGSQLRGFAAGGKGKGGDGSAIRGQDADRLYLEEMHYIAEEAITGAVLPLLQTKEETYMVGFSTPSGMRTPFYSFCEEAPHCKEFHHSYRVLPHYKAVEADRNNFTSEKWTHEFEADWGSSESGVYNPKYVDAASQNYRYSDEKPKPGWKYCVGTDWNEKHGTEIAVVGLSPMTNKFKTVETLHIEPSEFTQLEGVKTLLSINKKWKPDFIYIDAGNGCLHKDSLVYTINGVKQIKDIVIGDYVLSHEGEFRLVTNAVNTGTKESYLIKPAFCLATKASRQHRHVIYRSKDRFNDFNNVNPIEFCSSDINTIEVTTEQLDKDKDFFLVPKQNISKMKNSLIVDLAEELSDVPNLEYDDHYIWNKHSFETSNELSISNIVKAYNTSGPTVQRTKRKLKNKERLAPAEKRLAKQLFNDHGDLWYISEPKKTPRFIDILDPDFLYVYGWYLSEGYSGKNSIEICQMPFHYKEEFERLINVCSNRWKTSVLKRDNGMIKFYILDSVISKFFSKIGGKDCYSKFIDKRIMENNGHELLPSLIYGDGHEHKHGVNLSMTSKTLVYQVRQMLVNNGILSGIHYIKPRKRKDGYKDSVEQLMLSLNSRKFNVDKINSLLKTNTLPREDVQRRKYIELDDCFLVPIKKADYIGEISDMYDLTVNIDETFCVNGFATHNSTNYELIRKRAMKARGVDPVTANLLKILKRYDSGASIETKDPVTKQKVKKPAKPFMINASVRMFEQYMVSFPSEDIKLDKQLRNYIIERHTPNGNPVYGLNEEKIGDHRLDAFNLAIVAFHLEFDSLHMSNKIETRVGVAPDPRRAKKDAERTSLSETSTPSSRRVEDNTSISPHIHLPGKIDKASNIGQNRLGWATDEEEKYAAINRQRSMSRNRVRSNRPKRSNF